MSWLRAMGKGIQPGQRVLDWGTLGAGPLSPWPTPVLHRKCHFDLELMQGKGKSWISGPPSGPAGKSHAFFIWGIMQTGILQL